MRTTYCPACDEPMDSDCEGEPRCFMCDGPCPCCDDGGYDPNWCEDEDCEDEDCEDEDCEDEAAEWLRNAG